MTGTIAAKPLPVVGGTWQGTMIAAVHLYGDPLHPDDVRGVILGWIAHKDEYAIFTMGPDREIVNGRYQKTLERALFVYARLVVSELYAFANTGVHGTPVPVLTFDAESKES